MRLLRLTLAALALACTAAAGLAKVTARDTQTHPLSAHGRIELSGINGHVEIIAWDKAEVRLEIEKGARNQEALDRLHVKVTTSPDHLVIKTEHEKTWKFWDSANAYVNYTLHVPAGAALDKIDVVNASIRVDGVKGPVNLDTVNGGIVAKGLAGPGRFDTVNGSIEVAYAEFGPDVHRVVLDTVNGSCALELPAQAAFDLDADTVNGHVSCDFPVTLKGGGRHAIRGPVNGGGPDVKLDSVNGGLRVEKGK